MDFQCPCVKKHEPVLVNIDGIICGYTFAAANVDERDMLQDMTYGISGLLIADKGYIRSSLKEELAFQVIDLQTPLRKNMHDKRSKEWVKRLTSTRRRIETVIGQLVERFQIEKVHAQDIWHFTNRFVRKLLAHTICAFLNYRLGNDPLQFEKLIS